MPDVGNLLLSVNFPQAFQKKNIFSCIYRIQSSHRDGFYKGLLDQLGLESKFYRGDAKRQLQKEIEIIRGVHGQKVVCVLDEAHLLEKETIEEFRFLLNYRFDSESPMALVLVGQSELWEDKLRLKRYDPSGNGLILTVSYHI